MDIANAQAILVGFFYGFFSLFEDSFGDFNLILFYFLLILLGFLCLFLYYIIPTWIFSRTLGKWVFGLKVYRHGNERLTLTIALCREIIKLVSCVFLQIGSVIGFIQLCMGRETFWDSLSGTKVVYARGLIPYPEKLEKTLKEIGKIRGHTTKK
jgi:uncharacterized RDD family membrane protein YckC